MGIWLWSDGDRLSGLVELGSVTANEFSSAFRRYGPVCLQGIDITAVRVAVYRVARGISPFVAEMRKGRYQPFKIVIAPAGVRARSVPITRTIDAMPMLI